MKKTLILACALALATLSTSAMAIEGGAAFVRAQVGNSDIEIEGRQFNDGGDTSAGVGGGYWFTPYVGIEGSIDVLYAKELEYAYLEDETVDLHSVGVGVVAKKNFGVDGNGFFLGGRAGLNRLTFESRDEDGDVIDDEASTKLYFGANAGFDFNDHFGLSLNYDVYEAEFDGIDVDVDNVSVRGEYRF